MVTVRVRFYGAVRTVVRQGQADFELQEGATLGDLVQLWTTRYGQDLVQMLFDPRGRLHDFAKIYLDGEEVQDTAWETPLGNRAARAEMGVFVLSPLVGGQGADGPCC